MPTPLLLHTTLPKHPPLPPPPAATPPPPSRSHHLRPRAFLSFPPQSINPSRRWPRSVASWSLSVTVPAERPVFSCECRSSSSSPVCLHRADNIISVFSKGTFPEVRRYRSQSPICTAAAQPTPTPAHQHHQTSSNTPRNAAVLTSHANRSTSPPFSRTMSPTSRWMASTSN